MWIAEPSLHFLINLAGEFLRQQTLALDEAGKGKSHPTKGVNRPLKSPAGRGMAGKPQRSPLASVPRL